MTRLHLGRRRPEAAQRGQGLVEFALVLPIFLLMLFGLIDGGRFVYENSVVSQAAREGARLATVEARWLGSSDPSCGAVGGPTCPATVTGPGSLQADVASAVNRMVAPFGSVSASATCSSGAPTRPASPPARGPGCPASTTAPTWSSPFGWS